MYGNTGRVIKSIVTFCVLEGRPRGTHGLSCLLAINKQFK